MVGAQCCLCGRMGHLANRCLWGGATDRATGLSYAQFSHMERTAFRAVSALKLFAGATETAHLERMLVVLGELRHAAMTLTRAEGLSEDRQQALQRLEQLFKQGETT